MTALITANYAANNQLNVDQIGSLISSVHEALASLNRPVATIDPEFIPAISVRKSLADPTKIISMIDGKPYSMLKRHLTGQGLTANEYRTRYKLPADYPMIAPAYSAKRKALALRIGLGRKQSETITSAFKAAPKGRRKP
jgi:predicted transcriptional regulator